MRGYKVERRFGWDTHGLPAELEVQRQLGITDKAQIEEMGIEKFNDACRASVLQVHRRVAGLRHPPGALGRLRQRLQDTGSRLHGVGDLGVQAAVGQGPGLRGHTGCCRTAGTTRRRCPATNCAWTTTSIRAARTRRITVGLPGRRGRRRLDGRLPADLDDDAVDAAVQPGGRGQPRRHLRRGARPRRAGATCWRRRGWRPTPANSGRNPRSLATYTGPGSARHALPAAVPVLSWTSPNAFQVLPADFVSTEDGTGIVHMSPAYGEDDMATADRRPTSSPSRRSTPRAASTRRCPTTRASMCSTPTRRSSAT